MFKKYYLITLRLEYGPNMSLNESFLTDSSPVDGYIDYVEGLADAPSKLGLDPEKFDYSKFKVSLTSINKVSKKQYHRLNQITWLK